MKGMRMESPWRTVQLFISSQYAGIFEVEVDTETHDVRCTCPVWDKRGSCKHTAFVNQKMKYNNGHYSIHIPGDIPEELVEEAISDPAAFRQLVIKYNSVEVL